MGNPLPPLPQDLFTDWTGVLALRLEEPPGGSVNAGAVATEFATEHDIPRINAIEGRIRDGSVRNLVADVRGQPMINTAKLGLLLRLRNEISARGGEVVVVHSSEDIAGVFTITRLDRMLRVVRV